MSKHDAAYNLADYFHAHMAGTVVGLSIAVVLLLIIAGRYLGDFFPMLIMFAGWAFGIFLLPRFPHSPVSCLQHHNDPCKGQQIGLMALFVVPLCLGQLYKEIRGDKRGEKGNWRR